MVWGKGLEPHIREKGYRNHPMMPEQKEFNHRKSRVRSRVEHVFGSIANWRTKTEISLKHDV